ncbi:efflux RND transporter permease subunit [Edaphobacillus lindanitolerans]|uniref:Hydrophobic/amphiphilic exporter-1, HAE1 family n=1 Tax=Edaphobacillus lindanitolerans TaxID=550447 RepID=A0A1U7PPZ4_9BACI|nr:efflux RND transporter permease subunit [Edaphobacillus lindanitolerans]SIT88622.1 hydrophobic/amphiphilic exporter-1, HAE1 family [Edaphobacillus lindanitolerans]
MRKIINFSIQNKFAIWLLTIMAIAAGVVSAVSMKQESMPDITVPIVSVTTVYPGAAPNEVADSVTEPVEQRLKNVEGVKTVMSSSMENVSSIQLEFGFDKDMDRATLEVDSALEGLTLPENVQKPSVSRISLNAFPVIALSVTDDSRDLDQLTEVVEKDLTPALEKVGGVADVQVSGQKSKEIEISFDDKKLAAAGLDRETVTGIIQGSNLAYPLGLNQLDGSMKNIVIDGSIASLDALENLELPAVPAGAGQGADQGAGGMPGTDAAGGQDGMAQGEQGGVAGGMDAAQGAAGQTPGNQGQAAAGQDQAAANQDQAAAMQAAGLPTVTLSDVAKIDVVNESKSISRTNGKDSIGLQIVKGPDDNTVDVVNGVKDEIKKLEKDYGVDIESTFDQGQPIEEAVSTMLGKALYGALFAVIIILLFLRSFKTTVISVISIPLSLLMALLVLHSMDITLNIMTLGALTVAIGRVIDDSIVVVENIYRRMHLPDEPLRGKKLILEATREMFIPISSSTIVTIAVFLPLALVTGQVGELFVPFALSVVFALLASLLVAVTVVPMLAHTMFRKNLYGADGRAKAATKTERPNRLANWYQGVLNWALNHKWITVGASVVLLVASFFLVPLIGVTFLPEEEQKVVMATYKPDPGQPKEEVLEVVGDAEKFLEDRKGVTSYQYSIEEAGGGMGMMMGGGANSALFFIEYDSDFENFSEEPQKLVDKLNGESDKGEWGTVDFANMSGGFELYVYADNGEDLKKASDDVTGALKKQDGLENVETDLAEAYDQYTFVADQKKLASLGLTTAQIGMALSDSGKGAAVTTVKEDGDTLDVFIATESKEFGTFDDLKKTEIPTALGTSVPLGELTSVEEGEAPTTVTRRNGKLYTAITADITAKDTNKVSADAKAAIDKLDLPSGSTVEFGGITEQINESFTQLGLAMAAAVAIVYFVLVVTFGGALAPFAILFSLPFAIIGSLVALWIAREPISVSALIGALMLIGIVVTNAIVLIDRVIHKEKEGESTRQALLEAGATRLRPILMTALATIFALVPLAIGAEGGGLISKGLGITVIGGLVSSTLLTLLIVPIVYEILAKFRRKPLVEEE